MARQRTFPLLLLISLLLIAGRGVAVPATAQDDPPLPARYATLTIDALVARSYGGGAVTMYETMAQTQDFTRYLISYPSDNLTIYGFMNVPTTPGPFPVIVAIHGYVEAEFYGTIDYTARYADDLARAGYLVLHPNLRNYFPSNNGPNLFRVGMAVDVLNLIALVRQTGGQPGALEQANPTTIGLWGHSMGGGISLRTITVDQGIQAAVLYNAMSGNEEWNFAKIQEWGNAGRGGAEARATEGVVEAISPINYLDRIQAAVSIHHGDADELVPPEWSTDLCDRLQALEKVVQCVTYLDQPHIFTEPSDRVFMDNTIAFFDTHLRPGATP